jgi:hypothetical protein
MDGGIVVKRFGRMSQRRIVEAIEIGKSLNVPQNVGKVDQQKAFLKIWGETIA